MGEITEVLRLRLRFWAIDQYIKNGGRCYYSKLPICFIGLNGRAKVSIDRKNNDIGYEDESNIKLVAVFFQSEFRKPKVEILYV